MHLYHRNFAGIGRTNDRVKLELEAQHVAALGYSGLHREHATASARRGAIGGD
jgi:hypothetical protein